MSDMLEQAIVDAEALKEAALKNAEKTIIEKYSHEIKKAMDHLLEQEDMDIMDSPGEDLANEDEDLFEDVSLAHTDDSKLCPAPEGDCPDEDTEIVINLTQLQQQLEEDEELGEQPTLDEIVDHEDLAISLSQDEEEVDIEEGELSEIIKSIAEKLVVDVKPVPTGQPGGGSNETMNKENEEIALAHEAELEESEELEEDEEKDELKESLNKLEKEKKTLLSENKKYKNMLMQLKEKLEDINLSNAKLLYTNRILGSASLNERQKNKIVEALSNVDSVEGAKVIFETLQSTVEGTKKQRTQESLSEVVRRSSTMLPRKREATNNPTSQRWKILAGINNT